MYSIAARASGGNEDHMAGYSPLVMGKAPLLWLDNLPTVHHLLGNTVSPFHNQLPGNI
jgi:hypothetical protein